MEASRSTLIKSFLAREGPHTIGQLYEALTTRFPQQFGSVSRTKFKAVYLKNMKEFGQIKVKPCRDDAVLAKLREDPTSRVTSMREVAWLVSVNEDVAAKHLSDDIDLSVSHKSIVEQVDRETTRSKDFWTGKTNKPHDWRAALKAAGHKTSL
ncbi:hypothetical protein H4R18_001831 [Coemansia javaensis]|uniref:Uncharacterized protein n=1 Tax=Coemansia javaensis TaxID=2761396 RepID=A0A9W8HCL8_9FUNG|nr:hypothetical protein H4R18_001831 [Coemansia javaensis]